MSNQETNLTPMQQAAHRVLTARGVPMSAYDVLAALRDTRPKIAPPTVYRTLRQLIAAGLVHRIESLNAYMACRCEGHASPAFFTICNDCGAIDEYLDRTVVEHLNTITGQNGFAPARQVIEVHGRCAPCRAAGDGAP